MADGRLSWKPGTPAVKTTPLTRVDIGRLTVKEGDSGSRTYQVPVRITGKNAGAVRLYASTRTPAGRPADWSRSAPTPPGSRSR
ncbi:hypothetical protein [Streptomyces sp. H-KF8]|uniref:hypothetical protein n=1 Tax=Streptomyces sp. H-KF8 TaxID=1727216 RepID=UPI001F315C71|nr:hypothetical protein [Streptomyces sp. H-KF8]